MTVRLFLFASFCLALSCRVSAEPISASYVAQVSERCLLSMCHAFEATFPVQVTFARTVVAAEDSETFHHRQWDYVPQFSDIPLSRPAVHPEARLLGGATEITTRLDEPHPVGWRHVGNLQQQAFFQTESFEYSWYLTMYRAEDLGEVEPPALSPEALVAFLSGSVFSYGHYGRSRTNPDIFTSESISYNGIVRLAGDPAPIPEPATLTLIGIGLGMGWRARNRAVRRKPQT